VVRFLTHVTRAMARTASAPIRNLNVCVKTALHVCTIMCSAMPSQRQQIVLAASLGRRYEHDSETRLQSGSAAAQHTWRIYLPFRKRRNNDRLSWPAVGDERRLDHP
jgi:hypothetical protein